MCGWRRRAAYAIGLISQTRLGELPKTFIANAALPWASRTELAMPPPTSSTGTPSAVRTPR